MKMTRRAFVKANAAASAAAVAGIYTTSICSEPDCKL